MRHTRPRQLPPRPTYNVRLILHDMAVKGWLPTDLAARAGVSDMTISRFLNHKHQSPPTAKKIAKALGRSIQRYIVPADAAMAS